MNRIILAVVIFSVALSAQTALPDSMDASERLYLTSFQMADNVLAFVDSAGHVTINDFQLRSVFNVGVALWDEYKAECYADSSRQEIGAEIGEQVGPNMFKYRPVYSEWVHKRSTLDGFVEFIRKKMKP